jgi:two-component system, NarL family, nitrate/nitrite response regulator NarL
MELRTMQASVSIFLIGQKTLAREGLRRILDEDPFRVEAVHDSARALIESSGDAAAPDMIVIDESSLDDATVHARLVRDCFSGSRIVVLAEAFRLETMVAGFKAGADGYIVKTIECEPLLESLKLVAMGEKVMPSEFADELSDTLFSSRPSHASVPPDLAVILSEREIETMRHLLVGSPNKVIANRLSISEATVKVHVKAILRKLNVQNRTQAAIWAVNNGVEIGSLAPGQSGDYQVRASA